MSKIHFNNILIYLLLLSILMGGNACGSSDLAYVLHSRVRLHRVIHKTAQYNKRYYETLEMNIKLTGEELTKKAIDLEMMHRKWRSRTNKFKYKYKALERELNIIEDEAEQYFLNLQSVVAKIQNPEFKKMEEESNQSLRDKWDEIYDSVLNTRDSMKVYLTMCREFRNILIGTGMRQNTANSIRAFKPVKEGLFRSCRTLHQHLQSLEALINEEGERLVKNLEEQESQKLIKNEIKNRLRERKGTKSESEKKPSEDAAPSSAKPQASQKDSSQKSESSEEKISSE